MSSAIKLGVTYRIVLKILTVDQINTIFDEIFVIFVPEYLQPADFSYTSVIDRRHRSYQKAGISANLYVEKQKFPCPTCSSVFSHKNNLYYHSKFECGQLPRFNCPYCVYRTKHVSNVRAHVRRKHPGNNVYAIDSKTEGNITNKKRTGHPKKLTPRGKKLIIREIKENPSIPASKLAAIVANSFGKYVHLELCRRFLRSNGFP
ncbi:hypothetical protein K0M31_008839 [Melipona bicolor]|uniref:C2H2-type domain-containing protein n=1 Tax=Melipona bicolor TaxID=60889 RepID=A0AA40FQM9_9HYME|nr:hypothetical protein K0M31_008839 [Melipona bicolor]